MTLEQKVYPRRHHTQRSSTSRTKTKGLNTRILHSSSTFAPFHSGFVGIGVFRHRGLHGVNSFGKHNNAIIVQRYDGVLDPDSTIGGLAGIGETPPALTPFKILIQVCAWLGSMEPILYASTKLKENGTLAEVLYSSFQPPSRFVACQTCPLGLAVGMKIPQWNPGRAPRLLSRIYIA